jgi:cytochrome c-type biogenesis protein CcmH
MSLFWLASGTLVLLVLGVLLRSLLGIGRRAHTDGQRATIATMRGELASLRAQRDAGTVDQETYLVARQRLADSLLTGLEAELPPRPAADIRGRALALALAILLPLSAFGLYAYLGAGPAALQGNQGVAAGAAGADQSLDAVVARLEARLQDDPEDGAGWDLLGQSYLAQGRFAEAEAAYEHAYRLQGDEPALLVRYAEAMARVRDGNLVGRPSELLDRALQLAPDDELALWYGGLAAYQRGEGEVTLTLWRKLLSRQDPSSEAAQAIGSQMARIEAELDASAGGSTPPPGGETVAAGNQATLQVEVSLSPSLQERSDPAATLFVYARAANGPKAPLALVREQAGALPLSVTLSDAHAMMPQLTLSRFPQVEVVARISPGGQATPQSGDLIGVSGPIDQARQEGPVQVQISEVVE